MTIQLANRIFKTKKALTEECRRILHSSPVNECLTGSDLELISALLEMHTEYELKKGSGIIEIFVGNQLYGNKGFFIRRIDQSVTDFSFLHCITPTKHHLDVKSAFRFAIEYQIKAFAAQSESTLCAISGESLTDAVVDHAPPTTFAYLMQSFLTIEKLTYDDIEVEPTIDNTAKRKLIDLELEKRWQTYHESNAVLRLVNSWHN